MISQRPGRYYPGGMALDSRRPARLLAAADAFVNRLYGSHLNPLYQSGTIAVALLLVLLVTGLWLVLFYRIGAPWDSVARITDLLAPFIERVASFIEA